MFREQRRYSPKELFLFFACHRKSKRPRSWRTFVFWHLLHLTLPGTVVIFRLNDAWKWISIFCDQTCYVMAVWCMHPKQPGCSGRWKHHAGFCTSQAGPRRCARFFSVHIKPDYLVSLHLAVGLRKKRSDGRRLGRYSSIKNDNKVRGTNIWAGNFKNKWITTPKTCRFDCQLTVCGRGTIWMTSQDSLKGSDWLTIDWGGRCSVPVFRKIKTQPLQNLLQRPREEESKEKHTLNSDTFVVCPSKY